MASKYVSVIGKLPRMEAPDPEYQERVNQVKAALLAEPEFDRSPSGLTKEYAGLRREKDAQEEVLKGVQLRLEAVSQLLIAQFETEGITKMDLDPIVVAGVPMMRPSVSVGWEPAAQVQDRELFRVWCCNNGLERSLALPYQTMNSLTKNRLLEGQPEPDGVTAVARPKITFRKG